MREVAGAKSRPGSALLGPVTPPHVRSGRWSIFVPRLWRQILLGLAVYTLSRPVLAIVHELLKLVIASALHQAIASGAWRPLLARLPVDPVYTGAAIRALGADAPQGLALSGPFGAWLHALLPGQVLDPVLVWPGAFASLVMASGAPPLDHAVVAIASESLWIFAGLALVVLARRRAPWLGILGLLLQAQAVVHHIYAAHVDLRDLDVSGIPFAVALVVPGASGWFTRPLATLSPTLRQLLLDSAFLIIAYGLAAFATSGLLALRQIARRVRARHRQTVPASPAPRWALPIAASLALLIMVSPAGSLGRAASNWQPTAQAEAAELPLQEPSAGDATTVPTSPSVVAVTRAQDGSWQYLVNGQPTVIQGMGYNPQYASLPTDQRLSLYDRDFSAMHRLGINTIEGWFQNQFDAVTLQAAAQNDVGVLMPFELNQDWDYADPAVQQSILDQVSAWVLTYKDNPAVRMWAPGNENEHRVLFPHWVSMLNDPSARARADAFAQFLPRLVDRIHQLDPTHPVIYRDAEDVYLSILKPAFDQSGGPRPWLVYGTNVYVASRLQQIVDEWPGPWYDSPLVVSEYAPSGASPADRPADFLKDWSIIRSRPGVVLGGLAYTWATNGPEQLDQVFGLVDADGVPTDDAIWAVAQAYSSDQPQQPTP